MPILDWVSWVILRQAIQDARHVNVDYSERSGNDNNASNSQWSSTVGSSETPPSSGVYHGPLPHTGAYVGICEAGDSMEVVHLNGRRTVYPGVILESPSTPPRVVSLFDSWIREDKE